MIELHPVPKYLCLHNALGSSPPELLAGPTRSSEFHLLRETLSYNIAEGGFRQT